MIQCARCNSQMIEGTLFCDECGFNLLDQSKRQSSTSQIENQGDSMSVRSGWGTASFDPARQVVIYIRDVNTPVTIVPFDGFTIGRSDTEYTPDLDLGEYGGVEKGVSRRHATFQRSDNALSISDLGSSNGTYLNGVRLSTNQSRILRDGDELRFGNLTLYVYFQ